MILAISKPLLPLENWINQSSQPYLNIAWWVSHPLLAVVTVVVLLVMAQAMLALVSKSIKQLLLLMVKSPYLLLQWLLAKSSRSLDLPEMKLKPYSRKGEAPGKLDERLLTALKRLEKTQQEQNKVLKELKDILVESQKQASIHPTSTHTSTAQSSPELKNQEKN